MTDEMNRSAFDKLVAGMDASERSDMLEKINQSSVSVIQLVETENQYPEKNISLHLRFKEESAFYKFLLWVRSLIEKKDSEKIYNEDVLASMARRINRDHPGILNHRNGLVDSVFYEHLRSLKTAADFFKPYFNIIDDNPGDFYVFLSSFVTPELADMITQEADPFSLSFDTEPSVDVKNGLLKNLDNILKNIDGAAKSNLYGAVSSLNWLRQFTRLPYIHFTSQFTNLTGNNFTCPYRNAVNDYASFAAVFSNVMPVQNEVLEAMLMFTQRKDVTKNAQDKDIERTIKEFIAKANQCLGSLQMFISNVPIIKVGKIINADYDWLPGNIEGVEGWFPNFRTHWRKIIDVRWADWLRERKKKNLETYLGNDFGLFEFPVLKYRPWQALWLRVPFSCELTGGFLSWFCENCYDEMMPCLNDVMMEGVFIRNENRVEYSEGLNLFSQSMTQMQELLDRLAPEGEYGAQFEEFATSRIRSFQVQNQIDSMMTTTESEIRECVKKFEKGAGMMDKCLKGILSEERDKVHEGLQNFASIKGHRNRMWRDSLRSSWENLKKANFYLSELEPIDAATEQ
ncbi:hypothetical protein SAMN04487775_103248 [Treponema bryantii]|uniref:Uncharacterized protein n=1 Tax=Treponema bryantii TaxID=163 RepID=A0A1I3JU32_9SPIR|nr:DUF5312 family protein [Treponema bryantii]SFI63771.1 hypothetical protein SAMN04487775_103248 [Treponema bryantii]